MKGWDFNKLSRNYRPKSNGITRRECCILAIGMVIGIGVMVLARLTIG